MSKDCVLLCNESAASSPDVTKCAVVDNTTDPFDLEALRVSTDMSEIGIKKVVTVISCRKPSRQEFIRTRIGEEWMLDTIILEDQETHDCYLVAGRELQDYVLHDMREGFRARLRVVVNRAGEVFLWALKKSVPNGRPNRWNESAAKAAEQAESNWVRVTSNQSASCYEVTVSTSINFEPKWSELSLQEMIRICFKDRIIASQDHPFLKQLRGEI